MEVIAWKAKGGVLVRDGILHRRYFRNLVNRKNIYKNI